MKIRSFNVTPNLPDSLNALEEMATNMWFTWNWDAIMMFVDIDDELWHRSHRNPKWILGMVSPGRLEALSRDGAFLERVQKMKNEYEAYMSYKDTWFSKNHDPRENDMLVAYFSMEYGIGEGLPIYSGGLGMLSGDHLKSASDLAVPLVGVGLLYRKGYVQQVLNRTTGRWNASRERLYTCRQVKNAQGGPAHRRPAGRRTSRWASGRCRGRNSLYTLIPTSRDRRSAHNQCFYGDREPHTPEISCVGGAPRPWLAPTVHVNEGHRRSCCSSGYGL